MPEYDNRNRISLWKDAEHDASDPKSRYLRGTFVDSEGREHWVDLYKNQSDTPNAPVLKGKTKRKDQPAASGTGQQGATQPSADDLL